MFMFQEDNFYFFEGMFQEDIVQASALDVIQRLYNFNHQMPLFITMHATSF